MTDINPLSTLDKDLVREFVIAGHGNLARVREMLADEPALLNTANEWQPGDAETAVQAAAHVGNRDIAEYLLAQGAPLELCTAAMLGQRDEIERALAADPDAIHARGAHGIPLLSHAAFSGDAALVASLYERGATDGQTMALSNAVSAGRKAVAAWLLENADPDLAATNYQGKTALDIAVESGYDEIAALLRAYGAETA
ncbi:ankyrin repeat domain-containing protein [Promineifilum sp.]|uniref:ankyrin repeat domain-containing protein n=1 Tax=Promineifilum sp. TaxID=2664178 RepID=UPI0035B27522